MTQSTDYRLLSTRHLVAILGPTASGKSALAMKVARNFDGEIVCADSRTIYRGMDIGTAKPSATDQKEISHHLLDLVDPDEVFSAAEFKTAALEAIVQIRDRGHLPILVGGSGLYAYSVLYDYQFPAGARNEMRQLLEQRPLAELVAQLTKEDSETAATIDLKNPRRVIRALETIGQPRQQSEFIKDAILVGLGPDGDDLERNLASRTRAMIKAGLVAEVKGLLKRYPAETEAFKSPGYAEIVAYLKEETSLDRAEALINLHSRQLAKRQLTWLRRNSDINWFAAQAEAYEFVADKLSPGKL